MDLHSGSFPRCVRLPPLESVGQARCHPARGEVGHEAPCLACGCPWRDPYPSVSPVRTGVSCRGSACGVNSGDQCSLEPRERSEDVRTTVRRPLRPCRGPQPGCGPAGRVSPRVAHVTQGLQLCGGLDASFGVGRTRYGPCARHREPIRRRCLVNVSACCWTTRGGVAKARPQLRGWKPHVSVSSQSADIGVFRCACR